MDAVKKYYYLRIEKTTKKILGHNVHNVDKSQDEMDEIVSKVNRSGHTKFYYEQTMDDKLVGLMDAVDEAARFKAGDAESILDSLRDISSEINRVSDDISDKLRELRRGSE